jgi:hypothetical protein
MFATAWDSLGLQLDRMRAAASDGQPALVALGVLQLLALALPCLGIVVSLTRTGTRLGGGITTWARGSAPRAAATGIASAALAAFAVWTWWPNGDYEPIRPGERGTLAGAVAALPDVVGGRPSFTPEHADRFESVPTQREAHERRRSATPERPGATERATPTPTPAGGEEPRPSATPEDQPAAETTPPPPPTSTPDAAQPAPTATPTSTPTPAATPAPTVTPAATPTATATATPAG